MITYEIMGKLPTALPSRLLPRIARECSHTRARTKRGTWLVGLRFVPPKIIRDLNRAYRSQDRPTDVLSFSASEGMAFPKHESQKELGDIVICTSVARANAKRYDRVLTEELVRLIVHGTLHLLGYDHATPAREKRMRSLQEGVLQRVGTGK